MYSPEILRRADTCQSLPRLGGMARPDGVVIVSERFWAFARRDGKLIEGRMPSTPASLARVPLARGLARLAMSVAPLFRRSGVAKKGERRILLLAIFAPFAFVFLPSTYALIGWAAVTVGLILWIFRGRTLNLHGAEHRAIAAVEQRSLESTWAGTAMSTHHCGTFASASRRLASPTSCGVTSVTTKRSTQLRSGVAETFSSSTERGSLVYRFPGTVGR